MSNPSSRRVQIIELLELFGSSEEQLAYEHNVPHVDITAELICMWFNDFYHPESGDFESSFSASELAALAEFNAFYDERVPQLPDSTGTVRTWLTNPVWREVMNKAKQTLGQIHA